VIKAMVGRNMSERYPPKAPSSTPGEVVFRVENLTSANPRSFKEVSFDLRRGEILGIGGLVGAQRTELVESIFGLRKIASGTMRLGGKTIVNKTPNEAIAHGFALLTEERRSTGIVPMLSILENTLLPSWDDYTNKFGVIDGKTSKSGAAQACSKLNVKTPSLMTRIRNLSGGNQQKVLLSRWLLKEASILVLDEPTRGIDIGAKFEIYKIIRHLVEMGNSIIMVSSEMPELIGMSDRILIMCEGRVTGTLPHGEATQETIMRLATQF